MVTKSPEELMVYISELGLKDAQIGSSIRTALCITEEVGEVARALLEDDKEHAKSECVDTHIAAMGLFFGLGGTMDEYRELCIKQLDKWALKYENPTTGPQIPVV